MRDGNPDVFEEEGAASDRTLAMTIETVARNARQVRWDEEGCNAVRAGLHRSGAAEDDRRVSLIRGGNRRLFAVDDVVVAIGLDPQAKVGCVRTAAWLSQGDGEESLARRQAREPRFDDLRLAVV